MALVHDEGSPYVRNNSSTAVTQQEPVPVKRLSKQAFADEKGDFTKERQSTDSDGSNVLIPTTDGEDDREQRRHELYLRFRPYILAGVALVILGWWISATVLKATRHRWYVAILSCCTGDNDSE
jgi:CNT family concentrative nucleoside transporter